MAKPVWAYDTVPVGDEFELDLDLTRELVREYCDAVGEDSPLYRDDSPLGYAAAPPTLLALLALRLPKTKYETAGWVHVKHDLRLVAPARAGTTLKLRGRVVDKYVKRGREYADFEFTIADADGQEVLRGRNALLFQFAPRWS